MLVRAHAGWDHAFAERWAGAQRRAPGAALESGDAYQPELTHRSIPSGREYRPEEFLSWQAAARQGKPAQLMDLYDEMEVFGVGPSMEKARQEILNAESQYLPNPRKFQDEEVKGAEADLAGEVAAWCEDVCTPHHESYLLGAFRADSHGFSGMQPKLDPGAGVDGRDEIEEIVDVPNSAFEIDQATQRWLIRPVLRYSEVYPIKPFRDSADLIFIERGKDCRPLDQRGLQWQCVYVWMGSRFGFRWLLRLAEVTGIPLRKVTYKSGSKGKALAQQILRKSGQNLGVAIPEDLINFEFVNGAIFSGKSNPQFEVLVWSGRWFDRVYCLHAQASDVLENAGSQASSGDAQSGLTKVTNSRNRFYAAQWRQQFLRHLVRRNFGDRAVPYTPVWNLQIPKVESIEAIARAAVSFKASGAGEWVDVIELLRRAGVRIVKKNGKSLGKTVGEDGGERGTPVSKKALSEGDVQRHLEARFKALSDGETAPPGVGEEIVRPIRDVIAAAVRDGARPTQVFFRLLDRIRSEVDAPELQDTIAATALDLMMRGLDDVRIKRAA